jgi:copper chaperone CopZ
MKISKFFCMLIAGLAIIGFTTIGHATEETESEAAAEVVLYVKGMTCAGCENKVKTALMNCEGVEGCEVNWKEGKATVKVVKGSANTAEMIKAVEETGFTAESTGEIQYGADPWVKAPEGLRIVEDEAKVEEKE